MFIIIQFPVVAFADSVTLNISKSEAQQGEEIQISGTANGVEEIVIKIVSPTDSVFYLDVLPVINGKYDTTVGLPTSAGTAIFGDYLIVVGNDTMQAEGSVSLLSNEPDEDDDNDNDDGGGTGDDGDDNQGGNGGNNDGNDGDQGSGDNGDDNTENEGGSNGDSGNDGANNGNEGSSGEDSSGQDDEDTEELPDTSTSIYNYLIVGLVLVVIGGFYVVYRNSKRIKE
ncbi:LPXTG cell wall anchor domain-containing protein [Radiobacillus sp. PE A8.2]|uniref:LPXTG cell wall anchor domain-containing protein n=1 Tax=Radiobacillus sp. PE A8.2 TaxID=3380349 RepID=UPI00388E4720